MSSQSDCHPPHPKKMKVTTSPTKVDTPHVPTAAEEPPTADGSPVPHCQHFVARKKRFCKMTVAKGKEYCGEHLPNTIESSHEDSYIPEDKKNKRIPCPLDPKHTVYAWNVAKHLKICNAKRPTDLPAYIVSGINLGADEDGDAPENDNVKLSEVAADVLQGIVDKVNRLYETEIEGRISESFLDHSSMAAECAKEFYGPETLKHLVQTSALLGYLRELGFLEEATSFVEFGAGKGHLSYWLAQVIKEQRDANVVLVDRASHRHKQDNKVEERNVVHRIRADIADLDVRQLDVCAAAKHLVGVSKHLCGAATDLAIRCLLNDGESATEGIAARTRGLVIALCCHHRCSWRPFVGKALLLDNGIGRHEFGIMTKMVSWAICGSGMSRETRRAMEATHPDGEEDNQTGSYMKFNCKQKNTLFIKSFQTSKQRRPQVN